MLFGSLQDLALSDSVKQERGRQALRTNTNDSRGVSNSPAIKSPLSMADISDITMDDETVPEPASLIAKDQVTVELSEVKKITAVSVDINPPSARSAGKYAVVFEVVLAKSLEDGPSTLRKTDHEIGILYNALNAEYQNKVKSVPELSNGPPTVLEINLYLRDCVLMFE